MPKTITPAMANHLAQPVTTMTLCWLIVRLDGAFYAYTKLDTDVFVTDGRLPITSALYRSTGGFSASALVSHTTGQVDNQEIVGYFDPAGIIVQDLENGKFDYAQIYYFAINWADLSMGIVPLKRGYLGECTITPSGVFTAEMRGLSQLLVQEFGNTFQPICRADLGDGDCKIPIIPTPWTPNYPYAVDSPTGPLAITSVEQSLALFKAIAVTGPSGSTEPNWIYDGSSPTIDGGVTWIPVRPYRSLSSVMTPIGNTSFIASTVILPGTTLSNGAAISIINGITAGTTLEITDGLSTFSFNAPFDTDGQTFFNNLVAAMSTWSLNMTFAVTSNGNISLTNNTGVQGSIQKTGDLANGIRIADFSPNYLDGGTLKWLTGNNAGVAYEIKTYDPNQSRIFLWAPTNFPMQPGDQFIYYAGCDKTRATCFKKFNNAANFRGEPDMPGVNRMLQFADAT